MEFRLLMKLSNHSFPTYSYVSSGIGFEFFSGYINIELKYVCVVF